MREQLIHAGNRVLLTVTAIAFVWLAGCGHKDYEASRSTSGAETQGASRKGSEEEAEIRVNRAKLSPADLRLVEAQEFCPIMEDSHLGAMGVPVKVTLKDKDGTEQPVFVCCKGCVKKAQRNAEETLARVEQLKARAKAAPTKK